MGTHLEVKYGTNKYSVSAQVELLSSFADSDFTLISQF